jgi:outer membrane lipase/esterase
VAFAFNQALSARLATETGVIPFDVFSFVDGIVAKPAKYGLTGVADACCANLSTALFDDGIHPTAAGHSLLATAMLSAVTAVPEPADWLLMDLGLNLAALPARRRRRG